MLRTSEKVVRRALSAQWRTDDQDPHGEVNVELVLPDGAIIWPVQRVMKRFRTVPKTVLRRTPLPWAWRWVQRLERNSGENGGAAIGDLEGSASRVLHARRHHRRGGGEWVIDWSDGRRLVPPCEPSSTVETRTHTRRLTSAELLKLGRGADRSQGRDPSNMERVEGVVVIAETWPVLAAGR